MKTPSIQQLSPHDREAAQFAARTLQEHGFRAWIVGGGVRDLALGITPKDIDLATDALPGQVEEIFDRTIPVGKAFGTIVALIEVGGAEPVTMQLEVTTLRRDGDYSDGRRPDVVLYGTSMDEDAQRRDFTCNALYLDPLTDEISDVVGGLGDLENGVLRTVGDPVGRFREDGLRLLRMARFAAAYGLEIEGDTWAGARDSLDALVGISRERV
ncbi:MAG: tRNA nucleotidyltransferase/poly(A) polymerase, partial [Gammaproteobacteria bacterium]